MGGGGGGGGGIYPDNQQLLHTVLSCKFTDNSELLGGIKYFGSKWQGSGCEG